MQYLFDTNMLIEAKNDYFRFSFCPGYWDWLLKKNDNDTLFTIDKVKNELVAGNDDLSQWVKNSPTKLIVKPSAQLAASLSAAATWVNTQTFTTGAKDVFFRSADYYLIAYAHSLSYTVVTREISDPNSKKRVKIPDVCIGIGVNYINPFQFLEDEGAKFVCDS